MPPSLPVCGVCSATIADVTFVREGGKEHAVYGLVVSSSDGFTWRVDRRYREFRALHRACVGGAATAPFPERQQHERLFRAGTTEPSFVEARRAALQTYLSCLLETQTAGLSTCLVEFLRVVDRQRLAESQEGGEGARRRAQSEAVGHREDQRSSVVVRAESCDPTERGRSTEREPLVIAELDHSAAREFRPMGLGRADSPRYSGRD